MQVNIIIQKEYIIITRNKKSFIKFKNSNKMLVFKLNSMILNLIILIKLFKKDVAHSNKIFVLKLNLMILNLLILNKLFKKDVALKIQIIYNKIL